MHLAARNGYAKIVELLLQRGADTGLLNDEGRNPYQLSLGKGRQKVAELIRGFGQANCDG
ncbi:hypothetical protein BC826DRAFT_1027017 [Russula brevipes]|nr:hypothetical protein BC826DRAFT_1027017 [Russula brevipes]